MDIVRFLDAYAPDDGKPGPGFQVRVVTRQDHRLRQITSRPVFHDARGARAWLEDFVSEKVARSPGTRMEMVTLVPAGESSAAGTNGKRP